MNIISLIADPDDKTAYENTKKIASESEFSDKYYKNLAEFAALLDNKKSYIRTMAMILLIKKDIAELRELIEGARK